MAIVMKPSWTKPSTILFASEIPADERAFAYALAQATEFGANLILFHAYDTMIVAASENAGIRYYDYAATARAEIHHLEPLAERARAAGVQCEIIVRPGLATDQILGIMRERNVDRVVMGTHSPGPIGKLLVGSVAEAVVRSATAPVFVVGPEAADGAFRNYATRTILCAVSLQEASYAVVALASELAVQHNARLVLQHVIKPQDRMQILAGRSMEELEGDLLGLIPESLRMRINALPVIVPGDATEELLYQSRAQQADLIVLGAQAASALSSVSRNGVVYKVLAHTHCPVMAIPPAVLAEAGVKGEKSHAGERFLAGVV